MHSKILAAAALGLLLCGPSLAQTPAAAPDPPAAQATRPPPPPPPAPPLIPGQPVEYRPPNAVSQTPAFPQQTRAPYTPSNVHFQVKTVASGLHDPWGLAFLPDGRMLVTERPGQIRVVSGGQLSEPIEGVPTVHIQQISGLQDIVIDPKFKSNHLVYWTFVEARTTGSATSVARGRLVDGPKPHFEDVTIIYRQKPDLVTEHSNYGGRMLFDPQGNLLVTLGDRDSMSVRPLIQQMDTGVGKVVRITTDGKPAPGNPFVGKAGILPEIWASGFRNPLGIGPRPGTKEIWVVDVGPFGGDELDLLKPGGNYGWPVIGYGLEYSRQQIGVGTQKDGLEQPVYYWDPVISPSSVMFYSGGLFPAWKGDAFVTSLTQRHLVRLVLDGQKVVGEDRLLVDLKERLREVKQGPDGGIYILTDSDPGRLLELVP